MNQLLRGLLKDFTAEQTLDGLTESQLFECLATYCVLAGEMPEGESIEDLMAGDETVGFDALAIIVNGDLVLDAMEADDIADENRSLDVSLIFVQAKTSEKFERSEILNFGETVFQFFQSGLGVPKESAFVKERRKAKDRLYSYSAKFKNRRPTVKLAYVTGGQYSTDPNLDGAAESVRLRLLQTGLFETVEFNLVDASQLHKAFVSAKNRVHATISFERRVSLPKIAGVNQAYVGVIPAQEFLKMIIDDEGSIRKSVFYDNVRDFQDMNPVNTDIMTTLSSSDAALFPVLNNGVTVVARDIRPVADDFTVEDYQIVNGCQTSHVLFNARSSLTADILIPLRLIVTDQDSVASQITKATNRQTLVDENDLQALTDFQKELESHYRGYTDKQRLYYERRSKQYSGEPVEQTRVISPVVQMRSFAAFFLDEPHTATRYYRQLYKRVPKELFSADHRLEPYYTAAFAWYRLDVAFRRRLLAPGLRMTRYHFLAAFKYLALPDERPPRLNDKAMIRYCERLNTVLLNEQHAQDCFKRAGDLIREVGAGSLTRDTVKRERFSRDLLLRLRPTSPAV